MSLSSIPWFVYTRTREYRVAHSPTYRRNHLTRTFHLTQSKNPHFATIVQ